jgi:Viral BACON domain/Putative binding domain, N-terminal
LAKHSFWWLIPILLVLPAVQGFPQTTAVNPRTVEFDPSADHNTLTANNQPMVTRYELGFYLVGATQPYQAVDLGKPTPDATTGKIVVDFSAKLAAWPLPSGQYQARVTAIGPTGSGSSGLSNTFTFTSSSTPACSYSVSPTTVSVVAGGGTALATVTTAAGCTWTATSGAAWVTVSPAGGASTGALAIRVAANTGMTSRTGAVTIAGQSFTVTQAAGACTYSISPEGVSFGSNASTSTVTVTTVLGCNWTVTTDASWITVSPASGSGNRRVTVAVTANTTTTGRAGAVTIGGRSLTVMQEAPATHTASASACTYAVAPASAAVAGTGGTTSVTVTTAAECSWTASRRETVGSADSAAGRRGRFEGRASGREVPDPEPTWISVNPASGRGSGAVSLTAAANTGTTNRSVAVTIAGQTVTVTQAAPECSCVILPTTASVAAAGGGISVTVTAKAGCRWKVANGSAWVTAVSQGGSGRGTVTLRVAANTGSASRTAILTIGSQAFGLTQSGTAADQTKPKRPGKPRIIIGG